jgi:hypothetical protein
VGQSDDWIVNIIISVDAVPNVVDTARVEIVVMWPVINDTLEPLDSNIPLRLAHTRARIM